MLQTTKPTTNRAAIPVSSVHPVVFGRMVFDVAGEEATWTTMIHYHRLLARPIWELAANAHRALVPQCLRGAQRTLNRADTTSQP